MRAGRLRHRVIMQAQTETQSSTGAAIITWRPQDTIWAGIEPLSGKEFFAADSVQAEVKVRIVIRYHKTVTAAWRVYHDGLFYDIKAVLNENVRNRMITLMCAQGVTDDKAAAFLKDTDGNPLTFVDGEIIETVD